MLCIQSESPDPYFNLSSEEYLLRCFEKDVFLLYRNSPSIIVGKHQNTLAEINYDFVRKNRIAVARRISGGGTVFHDFGNLNFAFFTGGREGELVNYRRYTFPIIEALGKMGLKAILGERNELLLGNLKISGTASHVHKQRVMHHGTLLFSSEMDDLSDALKAQSDRFSDRAVKSVSSKVTNISDHLARRIGVDEFQEQIYNHVLKSMDDNTIYNYGDHDLIEIAKLRKSKFSTWEWNFGYSPKYQLNNNLKFEAGNIHIRLNVVKGIIGEVKIQGDFISEKGIHVLEDMLVGSFHNPESLRLRLSGILIADYITGLDSKALISALFV